MGPFVKPWQVAGIVFLSVVVAATIALFFAMPRLMNTESLETRLDRALAGSADGLYRSKIGAVRFEPLRRSFVVSEVSISPDSLLLAARREKNETPRMRILASASLLRLDGIDFGAWARGRISAKTVTLEDPRLEVHFDRRVRSKSKGEPATLPHEQFRSMDRAVRFDSVFVKRGDILFSELAVDAARPGTIRFSDLWATARHVTNAFSPRAQADPCIIDVHAKLADAGRVDATVEYNLNSPTLDLDFRGTVGGMDARAFNEMLVDLKGIRVASGHHDSTWFEFAIKDDVAAGKIQVLYHDLDIQLTNKVTHESDASDKLMSFINNQFKLRDKNPPDDNSPGTVAQVRRPRAPETPLLKFIWETIREGLLETIGVADPSKK